MSIVKAAAVIIAGMLFVGGTVPNGEFSTGSELENLYRSSSYIPEEEAYTHIAGGFFSVFEGRIGKIYAGGDITGTACIDKKLSEDALRGSSSIKLNKLRYESRFKYLPEGEIVLNRNDGAEYSFSMKSLDYVDCKDIPFYRLTLSPGINCPADIQNAYLICYATVSSRPYLYGILSVTTKTQRPDNYYLRISGRDENQADVHLYKKIAAVTEL